VVPGLARQAWNYEFTALHYAVIGRMPEMVRLLMEFGADPHAGISPHNGFSLLARAWTEAADDLDTGY
jgi:hypothetical protein